MTTTITIDTTPDGIDDIRFSRNDNTGMVSVAIAIDDTTIDIYVGTNYEDVRALEATFSKAAGAALALLTDWEDRPDSHDGYITHDNGRYHAMLGRKQRSPRNGYPTREIAVIELAQAMVDDGYFPNCWYEDRGYTDDIDDEVRARHDEGGTAMLALDTEYLPDQEVQVNHRIQTGPMTWEKHWLFANVIRDYGDAGIHYSFSMDDDTHVIADREDIRVAPEQPDEDEQ